MISVVVLPKLGVHNAMRLFLTGDRFEAARARDYGLVHRVVAPDALEEAVLQETQAIALGGPMAVAEAKRLIRIVSKVSMAEGFAYAEKKIAELFASEEAAEGMGAFVTKRPPKWAE
jgi:methylglutaconyl-CoA hydratase